MATVRKPTLNSSILVAYPPSQPRRVGYPLGLFPTQVGLRTSEKYTAYLASSNKKTKQNLSESDSENEAADFPRFIVIKSLEEVCHAKFSPFLIEKVISTRACPKTVKKTRNGNLLVEGDYLRQAENIKIKTFHTTKCRAYLHEKLNTSKGVIRSRELALATEDEIASALGKQGVTNIKRISIRKGEERIQPYIYILTFNKPQTPKEVKIGYFLERIEQYIPAPLRCFKCQKFGHHREACRERQACSKCGEKDPDHAEEDCLKIIRCANCKDHQTYARTCTVFQKEKEIIEVKHKRNVSFLKARRIVGSYMGESNYASVAQRADRTKDDTKYRTLVEKLLKLAANDWPNFQVLLKKLHSIEFYQAPAQQQVANGERSNVVVPTKTHVESITPTWTTPQSAKSPSKQPLHKSPIRPPKSIKDRLKNLSSIRPEQLKLKSQLPISQTAKIQMNTKVNKERLGSTFKIPSTTKSPITTKKSNSQQPTKPLQRTYSIESMESDTDRLVASLNLEEIIKKNTILETT